MALFARSQVSSVILRKDEEEEDLQQQQREFSLGVEVMVEMSSSCAEKLNRYIWCLRSFQERAGTLSDNCVRN